MPLPRNLSKNDQLIILPKAFNIAVDNQNKLRAFEKIPLQTLDAIFDAVQLFKNVVNRDFGRFIKLVKGLNKWPIQDRITSLVAFNSAFLCQELELPKILPARCIALRRECEIVQVNDRQFLRAFYLSRSSKKAFEDIEKIFYKGFLHGHGCRVLPVMKSTMQRNGDPSGLTEISIVSLCKIYQVHRPMSGFMGFDGWGHGDHNNPATNLEKHFEKHVCCGVNDSKFIITYGLAEPLFWWKELRIDVTAADFENAVGRPVPSPLNTCFEGNAPLSGDGLIKFFRLGGQSQYPAFITFIKSKWLNQYKTRAIDFSKVMQNVIVHSNGVKVFISGRYGEFFIIGRFEGNQLGISSCYIPSNMDEKLRGARSNMCSPLRYV